MEPSSLTPGSQAGPPLLPLVQRGQLAIPDMRSLLSTFQEQQIQKQNPEFQEHQRSEFQESPPDSQAADRSAVLVLDLRSFLSYNQSHVRGAINVCIPKTLAKRQGFTVKSIDSGICKKSDKEEFKLRDGATVVLYDQVGDEWTDSNSLLAKCAESLVAEGLCRQVFWVEGGFLKLQAECPEFIQTARLTEKLKSLVTPKTSSKLTLSMSAPLTAPANATSVQDQPIVEVMDFLFLSGSIVADDYKTLKKHSIVYIINCAAELPDTFIDTHEFTYKRLDLQDTPSQHMCFVNVFENAFKVIDEARGKNVRTLVHCRGGRSRSATVVIAYLMRTFAWTLQQAYDFLQQKNPKISPNLGFMGQLIGFEAKLKKYRERAETGLLSPLEIPPQLSHLSQVSPKAPKTPLEGIDSRGSGSLGIVS